MYATCWKRHSMARFVFVPHTAGWGHRIRCDILASALMSKDQATRATLVLRPDDSIPPSEWTVVPSVESKLGRTLSILRATVMVEDGLAFADFRVKLLKRLGGKLVIIAQPWGFSPISEIKEAMRLADLILVPFPPGLFQSNPVLDEFADKVRVIPPISSVSIARRAPASDVLVVYCTITRPEPGLESLLERSRGVLEGRLAKSVVFEGRFGTLRSREEHISALARAHVVLTQGMTSAFEAIRLGIPVVTIPRSDVPEQVETSRALVGAALAEAVFDSPPTAEMLADKIQSAVGSGHEDRPSPWEGGEGQAVELLRSIARLPARTTAHEAWFSITATNYNCAHALEEHLQSIYEQFDETEFEYLIVDNRSTDRSPEILRRWAADHPNFRWVSRRCSMGRGRELAARMARTSVLVVVDTDTRYFPSLRHFVERATSEWPGHAIQAIYAGVFPRFIWKIVGGRANRNIREDFDMWMRVAALGRMRWYPVRMGENLKEAWARDADDYSSARYTRARQLRRLLRSRLELLTMLKYGRVDLASLWRRNSVDLGLGPLEDQWFGEQVSAGFMGWGRGSVRALAHYFRS